MQYGLFTMPSHPPERPLYEGHRWDLQTLRWADELGYSEAWIGEHHTAPWEPHPAPDLLIAQSLMETSRIRLAPGGDRATGNRPARGGSGSSPSATGRSGDRAPGAAPTARCGARRSRLRKSPPRRPSATSPDPSDGPHKGRARAGARAS